MADSPTVRAPSSYPELLAARNELTNSVAKIQDRLVRGNKQLEAKTARLVLVKQRIQEYEAQGGEVVKKSINDVIAARKAELAALEAQYASL